MQVTPKQVGEASTLAFQAFTIHPRQQPYYNLTLWADYLIARSQWEAAHYAYRTASSVESDMRAKRTALETAAARKDALLAELRKTPEHLEAFGW